MALFVQVVTPKRLVITGITLAALLLMIGMSSSPLAFGADGYPPTLAAGRSTAPHTSGSTALRSPSPNTDPQVTPIVAPSAPDAPEAPRTAAEK